MFLSLGVAPHFIDQPKTKLMMMTTGNRCTPAGLLCLMMTQTKTQ